jgi:hypothetical protein
MLKNNGFEAFLVSFDDPCRALEMACHLQQQLLATDWSPELLRCEKALRVKDLKSGALLFNGLRARVGIAYGRVLTSVAKGVVEISGTCAFDAIRIGKSAPGGDIWVSTSFMDELKNYSGGERLLNQMAARPIPDEGSAQSASVFAVGLVLKSLAGRISRFTFEERQLKVLRLVEKDIQQIWRVTTKLEAFRFEKKVSGSDAAIAEKCRRLLEALTPATMGSPLKRGSIVAIRAADTSVPIAAITEALQGIVSGNGASFETALSIVRDSLSATSHDGPKGAKPPSSSSGKRAPRSSRK